MSEKSPQVSKNLQNSFSNSKRSYENPQTQGISQDSDDTNLYAQSYPFISKHCLIIFKDFSEHDFNIFFALCVILITRKQRIIRISFEQLRSIMPNDKNKKRFYASVLSFAKKLHSLKAQKIDIDSDDFEVFSSYIFFEYIQAQQRYALLTLKLTKPSYLCLYKAFLRILQAMKYKSFAS